MPDENRISFLLDTKKNEERRLGGRGAAVPPVGVADEIIVVGLAAGTDFETG